MASVDLQAYQAAFDGKDEEAKALVKLGANVNMVIIGAADSKNKELHWWAYENGGCFLFSFQTNVPRGVFQHKFCEAQNHNLSMVKGPGDVAKGIFIKN